MAKLSKDELILIAKALTAYKANLLEDGTDDLVEYNRIEVANCDELAEKLDLDGDYYTPEAAPDSLLTPEQVELFRKVIDSWTHDENTKDIAKAYEQDRKDLEAVLAALLEGDRGTASLLASNLDTILRDRIPNDIYELIFEEDDKEDEDGD
jgi:hypothetical protein